VLIKDPAGLPMAARVVFGQHPVTAATMLQTAEQLGPMRLWIRHHHERWDGRGYPDRLVGTAIPRGSRMIALADVYVEAVGREGATAEAWRRLERMGSGTFDPDLLRLLDPLVDGQPVAPSAEVREPEAAVAATPVRLVDLVPEQTLVEPL
jgi:HD-GYP domain-containing protein (c-di-GMP phosphodiesterase class II)